MTPPSRTREYVAAYRRRYLAENHIARAAANAHARRWRAANKTRVAAYNKAYLAAHRETISARAVQRHTENPDKINARRRRWYEAHPEQRVKAQARMRAWAEANHDQFMANIRAGNARRRTRRHNLPSTLTRDEWEAIKHAFDYRCAYCKRRTAQLTKDHVIPIVKGGGTVRENIVPACSRCNKVKADNPPKKPLQLRIVGDRQ